MLKVIEGGGDEGGGYGGGGDGGGCGSGCAAQPTPPIKKNAESMQRSDRHMSSHTIGRRDSDAW